VPVYTGIVFSSFACVVITLLATVAYLTLAGAQWFGLLPFTSPPHPDAWGVAIFNLLVLNIVAGWRRCWRRVSPQPASPGRRLRRARARARAVAAHPRADRAPGRLYAVNEVVAGVTHEMRNVLQGVFGHLWLVRRKLAAAPPEVDEHLGQVEESCEHVMRIIRTTLDMARQPGDAPGRWPSTPWWRARPSSRPTTCGATASR